MSVLSVSASSRLPPHHPSPFSAPDATLRPGPPERAPRHSINNPQQHTTPRDTALALAINRVYPHRHSHKRLRGALLEAPSSYPTRPGGGSDVSFVALPVGFARMGVYPRLIGPLYGDHAGARANALYPEARIQGFGLSGPSFVPGACLGGRGISMNR